MSEKDKIINIVQDVLFSHHRDSLFSSQTRDVIANKIASAIGSGEVENNISDTQDSWGVVETDEIEVLTKVPTEEAVAVAPVKEAPVKKKSKPPVKNVKPNKNMVQNKMKQAQNINKNINKNNGGGLKNLKNK